ncbi:MAG: acyl carrier protein [Oscillospiraceae bacterium]|nr:acyl carrier protein [Oscillospiraceae bacterium]
MIFEKIRAIIADQFGIDEDGITMETNILEDLEADSLDVVELSMSIESEFSLDEMKEEDLKGIRTVGDLVELVSNSVN